MNETTGGAAGGAASGALMGTMIAPGPGTLIGAGVGLVGGLIAGQGAASAKRAAEKATSAQEAAQRAEMERRAQGVAQARQTFGDLWSYQDLGAGPGSEAAKSGDSAGRYAAIGAGIGGAATMGMGATAGAALGGALGRRNKHGGTFTPYDSRRQDASYWQNLQKTVDTHGQIAGGIESNANAVRDAGQQQLTGAAQQANVQNKGNIIERGLLGSSLGDSAKQNLLAQYAGGQANVAAGTEAARQGGWDANKALQQQYESMARGGSDISGQLRAQSQAGQIAGAGAQMPYTMFGNLLNTGVGLIDSGARAEAQGGMGLQALGLPSLGVGSRAGQNNRAAGAVTSGGGRY